jgi:hypothetical protein
VRRRITTTPHSKAPAFLDWSVGAFFAFETVLLCNCCGISVVLLYDRANARCSSIVCVDTFEQPWVADHQLIFV